MCIRSQGELRHQQQPPPEIGEGAIHSARCVRKNAVAEEPGNDTRRLAFCITLLHTEEYQETPVYARNRRAINFDSGPINALQQRNHATVAARSRAR